MNVEAGAEEGGADENSDGRNVQHDATAGSFHLKAMNDTVLLPGRRDNCTPATCDINAGVYPTNKGVNA